MISNFTRNDKIGRIIKVKRATCLCKHEDFDYNMVVKLNDVRKGIFIVTFNKMIKSDKDKIEEVLKEYELLVANEVFLAKKQEGLERVIIAIQNSTRVTFSIFSSIHNRLRSRYRWYYNWHIRKYANFCHIILVIIFSIILSYFILSFVYI